MRIRQQYIGDVAASRYADQCHLVIQSWFEFFVNDVKIQVAPPCVPVLTPQERKHL